MDNEIENKDISFVDTGMVREVKGSKGYQKPSYSHTNYGINKVVTKYIAVTENMLISRKIAGV